MIEIEGRVQPADKGSASPRLLFPERLHVLIVDDNEILVEHVSMLLRPSCQVSVAYDGVTGLALARAKNPDLIIIDLTIPGLHGMEVLREVRNDDRIFTVPVIMLSGNASEEARVEALNRGADDYLVKPFKPRELIARIHSHVRMVRMRRAAIERERALLKELGNARRDLRTVLERTSDAFISLDRSLTVLEFNDAAKILLDIENEPREAVPLIEQAPALHESAFMSALSVALAGPTRVVVEHHSALHGRWFEVRCYPTREGVTVFAGDITEQKAAQAALLAAHANLEERVAQRTRELRDLYHRLERIREEERTALAREVHDQLGQLLTAAKIDIKLLENELQKEGGRLALQDTLKELQSARRTLDEGLKIVRAIAIELRPPELEDNRLFEAIASYGAEFSRRTGIEVAVHVQGRPKEPSPLHSIALYRIVREAFSNVVRHAQASRIDVCAEQRGDGLLIRVFDNGVGISRERMKNGASLGLRGMRERAAGLGGKVLVGAVRNKGTLVAIRAPYLPQETEC